MENRMENRMENIEKIKKLFVSDAIFTDFTEEELSNIFKEVKREKEMSNFLSEEDRLKLKAFVTNDIDNIFKTPVLPPQSLDSIELPEIFPKDGSSYSKFRNKHLKTKELTSKEFYYLCRKNGKTYKVESIIKVKQGTHWIDYVLYSPRVADGNSELCARNVSEFDSKFLLTDIKVVGYEIKR